MFVGHLDLRDFRSYGRAEVDFREGLNVLVGPNGAGKTNLLEAVHVGVQGFPLRTRRDAATIRAGAEVARVEARGHRGPGVPFTTSVRVYGDGRKEVLLDGAPPGSLEELRRAFPVLAFTPDRLAVVKGGPIVRRTYLDRTIGRVLPAHAELPAEYASAVAQRNAALRRVRQRISSPAALAPWSEAVARLGQELDGCRLRLTELLAEPFAGCAGLLGLDDAALRYEPSEVSLERLAALEAADLERGTTGAGPHRAELLVTAAGRDLRQLGSQGEQRAAVLALLMAEARVLIESRRESPLLLLDDVLSELDDARRGRLLEGIPDGCQTVVTTTSLRMLPPSSPEPAEVIDVTPGRAIAR